MNNDRTVEAITGALSGLRVHEANFPGLVRRVTNAHRDDIHGMVKVNDLIVTGSKDTSVRLWSEIGDSRGLVVEHPETTEGNYSYKHWITALHSFTDGSVMVGCRNGYVLCKDIHTGHTYYSGILEKQINKESPYNQRNGNRAPAYKLRNEPRITSITCQPGEGYRALIGMPEKFAQLDLETNKVCRIYNLANPEWVYGFTQLNLRTIAVIHACCLSIFRECDVKPPNNGWQIVDTVVTEGAQIKTQRPFISDMNQFEDNPGQLALAFFGGTTRVIDLVRGGQVVHEGNEHRGRVWKTIPVDANSLMSCADDGLIKLWDIRQTRSVRTYAGHPDRVSALALLNNSMFVAASCPSNPHENPDKGQLFFYDGRL